MDDRPGLDGWRAQGSLRPVGGDQVFVIDRPAAAPTGAPPLVVIHGFPTSTVDYALVLDRLASERRVLLLDLPGYGLSAKPNRGYSLFGQADVVEEVVASAGLTEVDLLTHDMGDSVGGELLARSLDGDLPFAVRRRVLANGSIYIGQAQLTDGQQLLLSLPDDLVPVELAPDIDALTVALTATLASAGPADPEHLRLAAAAVVEGGGNRLLARLIRYVDERRVHEDRWTAAIEAHPSPLTIVWGEQDPVAVVAMAHRLAARRTDAALHVLDGVGHYPMLEAPDRFVSAVRSGLDD